MVKSYDQEFIISHMKDEQGRVLTYVVYSLIEEKICGEFNSLKEAREYVRRASK